MLTFCICTTSPSSKTIGSKMSKQCQKSSKKAQKTVFKSVLHLQGKQLSFYSVVLPVVGLSRPLAAFFLLILSVLSTAFHTSVPLANIIYRTL